MSLKLDLEPLSCEDGHTQAVHVKSCRLDVYIDSREDERFMMYEL